ncbi:hypothetical protein J2W49_000335 [Hydrogenophaga palleronii]|uniref:Uncharacterized protein n=1 Tax=Hydrogenophaga palleronii TaxID=65655 RepID=A0ABU1WGL0_9BURK|nr:DUF4286 family protein [Hydrogenophaga palleronii]MDR7148407.1 hypothetical protein [Hydrogenophaga palleronii]
MHLRGQAQLAIWSDIKPEQETDYLHWLTREHVLERVGVDGFLSGRVFRCEVADRRRFFITYELREAGALAGPSYLARLNAPTPWSQRTMPILQNFARGGGPVVARAGLGCGAVVVPLRIDLEAAGLLTAHAQQHLVQRIAGLDAVAQVWLMQVDAAATGVPTKEKSMRRSEEGAFDGVLVVEALHEAAARAAVDALMSKELASAALADREVFAACFQLDRRLAGLP